MATFKEIDENGRTILTISDVLAPVALTSVATSSTSNLLTVASTAGVYPGMSITCSDLPLGCFVHAVKSATVLELYATKRDGTTGVITTSATNAQATATSSSMLAYALSFDPNCVIAANYALGTWRNTIRGYENGAGLTNLPGPQPFTTIPTYSGGTISSQTTVASDEAKSSPLKRDNGEWWAFHILVSTGGFITRVPATSKTRIVYAGA